MSEPIGVGDWVECVDAGRWYPDNLSADLLTRGDVYRVQKVGKDGFGPYVVLREILSLDFTEGFDAMRFRPIYRPSESLFLTRLMDTPADPEQVMA